MNNDENKMTRGKMHHHMECMPLSFADHISMLPENVTAHLKFPPWLRFKLPYQRKDQAALTDIERERFICAFNVLNQTLLGGISSSSQFGQLVEIHNVLSINHYQHGTLRFLPWHRIYLLILEQSLRSIHPDVTIPYWDWTQASEQAIPPWLAGLTPTVVTPTQTINVVRAPGSSADLATLASNIPSIMLLTDFDTFTSQLEAVHGGVHVWVGGSMSSIPTAPADLIFWMHHANIDRLWWKWQTSPEGQGKNPNLPGTDPTTSTVMDPWSYTEPQTRDIYSLRYTYV
jgi:tyrosinase